VLNKQEISDKLDEIHQLERNIEMRMRDASTPVCDDDGLELTEQAIAERTSLLAAQLKAVCGGDCPLLVPVMDGALPFHADLERALKGYPHQYSVVSASSYGDKLTSEGTPVKITNETKVPVARRTVVIVDEVYDTGKTCAGLRKMFERQGAARVLVMVLVDKLQSRPVYGHPDFAGFTIDPNAFIIGKGLDYAGLLRNEPWIHAVNLYTLPTAEEKAILSQKKELNEQFRLCLKAERKEAKAAGYAVEFFSSLEAIRPTKDLIAGLMAETSEGNSASCCSHK